VDGDWYVTGTRHGRFGLMLGPFADEASAAARIDDVRTKLHELAADDETNIDLDTSTFDVYRLAPHDENPLGQLNRAGHLAL
jgi:hypothetical protein